MFLSLGRLIFYGLQHYLCLAGSLVFIPIIMVPAMGGTDVSSLNLNRQGRHEDLFNIFPICSQEETAIVISTMLLVSGLTTILHSFFGTRLPLVQGRSFVYLAPALVIINSEEFRNLSENVSSQFLLLCPPCLRIENLWLIGYPKMAFLLMTSG